LIGMAEFIKYLKSDFFNVLMKQLFFWCFIFKLIL
jgi:hypothetical protein